MSRSGYIDDCDIDEWDAIRWQGAVKSAIKGKRGQQALRETLAALDAMPEKELIACNLVDKDGCRCTLGVLADARGIDVSHLDPEDPDAVARTLGLAPALVREVVYENDEHVSEWEWVEVEICGPIRPHWRRTKFVRVPVKNVAARRWAHMRQWVADQLKKGAK